PAGAQREGVVARVLTQGRVVGDGVAGVFLPELERALVGVGAVDGAVHALAVLAGGVEDLPAAGGGAELVDAEAGRVERGALRQVGALDARLAWVEGDAVGLRRDVDARHGAGRARGERERESGEWEETKVEGAVHGRDAPLVGAEDLPTGYFE